MTALDVAIIVIYFGGMLAGGIYHSRRASSSVRAYFLGDNRRKWNCLRLRKSGDIGARGLAISNALR
jgi:hypothetical protein